MWTFITSAALDDPWQVDAGGKADIDNIQVVDVVEGDGETTALYQVTSTSIADEDGKMLG